MTSPSCGRRATGPWPRWVIGVGTFTLHVLEGIDYVFILAQDTAYIVETLGKPQVIDFDNYPMMLRALWTIQSSKGAV